SGLVLGEEMQDSGVEPGPFRCELLERPRTGRREFVVLARRAAGRLLPRGLDETFSAQPGEQWIDGPLAGDHDVHLSKFAEQLDAVAAAASEEGQHAVLQDTAPQLTQRFLGVAEFHATQGTGSSMLDQVG